MRPIVQKALERMVNPLCQKIDSVINPDGRRLAGFALMLFAFDGDEATYGSNADREDMIKALRECADRLERRMDLPHHDNKNN